MINLDLLVGLVWKRKFIFGLFENLWIFRRRLKRLNSVNYLDRINLFILIEYLVG